MRSYSNVIYVYNTYGYDVVAAEQNDAADGVAAADDAALMIMI